MSTEYRLLGLHSYWGLVGAESDKQLAPSLLRNGRLCALQDERLDVYLTEQVPSLVTVELGPPRPDAVFEAEAVFPAGPLKLDDSEAGYVPTDVELPREGLYRVALTELPGVRGHRRFHVTIEPRRPRA